MSDRRNFGKLKDVLEIPDLIGLQVESYDNFLQRNVPPEQRKKQGLQEVFEEIFPIESFDKKMRLEFVSYEIGDCPPGKTDVIDCIKDGKNYDAPIYVNFLLKLPNAEIPERVPMGEIPIMTERGTFIINGAERVIISQLHRSPGICFEKTRHTSGRPLYSYRVIPDRGSWIDVQFDINDKIQIFLDRRRRRRKFPITTFLRAIGYPTNRDILSGIYTVKTVKVSTLLKEEHLDHYYTIDDVTDSSDNLVVEELLQLNEHLLSKLVDAGIWPTCPRATTTSSRACRAILPATSRRPSRRSTAACVPAIPRTTTTPSCWSSATSSTTAATIWARWAVSSSTSGWDSTFPPTAGSWTSAI